MSVSKLATPQKAYLTDRSSSTHKVYNTHVINSLPKLYRSKILSTYSNLNSARAPKPSSEFNFETQKTRYNILLPDKKKINILEKQEYEVRRKQIKARIEQDIQSMNSDFKKVFDELQLKQLKWKDVEVLRGPENNQLAKKDLAKLNGPNLFTSTNSQQSSKQIPKKTGLLRVPTINRLNQKWVKFRRALIEAAKKLKYYELRPHQVLKNRIFEKIPYLQGKAIFKAVLAGDLDETWRLINNKRIVIYSYNLQLRTPLICAAIRDHQKIVELLLQMKSDINHIDMLGNTALMYAIKNRNMSIAMKLLSMGCRVETVNKLGESWADLAKGSGEFQRLVKVVRIVKPSLLKFRIGEKRLEYLWQQFRGLAL